MCKVGDVLYIHEYIDDNGYKVNGHPFIVIDDENGRISGLDFNMVCVAISSFKDAEHRKEKLSYHGNKEITVDEGVKKDGYIKCSVLHYISSIKTNYNYLFTIQDNEFINEILRLVNLLGARGDITDNIENL